MMQTGFDDWEFTKMYFMMKMMDRLVCSQAKKKQKKKKKIKKK